MGDDDDPANEAIKPILTRNANLISHVDLKTSHKTEINKNKADFQKRQEMLKQTITEINKTK